MSNIPTQIIGPHQNQNDDPRLCRPYFVIHLDPNDESSPFREGMQISEEIINEISDTCAKINSGISFSDIFIISHGWHRNFYSAISAYDRLLSRLKTLYSRKKLITPESFNPLFITLHWHSDPGENTWRDPSGRKNKDSFIDNVKKTFKVDENRNPKLETSEFLDIIETAFDVLARWCVSTPSVDNVNSDTNNITASWQKVRSNLNNLEIIDAPKIQDIPTKTMLLWDCYHRATSRRPLSNQTERPQSRVDPWTALARISGFLLAISGIVIPEKIVPFALPAIKNILFWPVKLSFGIIGNVKTDLPYISDINKYIPHLQWNSLEALNKSSIYSQLTSNVLIFILCFLLWNTLYFFSGLLISLVLDFGLKIRKKFTHKDLQKIGPFSLLTWLIATLYLAGNYIFNLFILLIIGKAWFRFLIFIGGDFFDERLGKRNKPINNKSKINSLGNFFGNILRHPTRIFQNALHEDTITPPIMQAIDSQISFYLMQIKAVRMGERASDAIKLLFKKLAPHSINENTRVHLFGHSFGGLLILNLWRHLVFQQENPNKNVKISTVTLLEAATAADWLQGEEKMLTEVDAVGNVFSRYDTANGFYYPIANGSRNAAGFVGLKLFSKKEKKEVLRLPQIDSDPDGLFSSLTSTPDIESEIRKINNTDQNYPLSSPIVVNLDASRMIYDGPPALGGGHNDIFKDDVIYLCWSIISLSKGWETTRRKNSNLKPVEDDFQ